jgi:signal transduction histidine kinase
MDAALLLGAVRLMLSPLVVWLFRILGLGVKDTRKSFVFFACYCVYLLVIPYGLMVQMGFYSYSKIASAVMFIPTLFMLPVLSSDDAPKSWFMHFTSLNAALVLTLVISALRGYFGLDQGITIVLMALTLAAALIVALRYFVEPLRFMAERLTQKWWIMTLVPILVFAAVLLVTVFNDVHFHDNAILDGSIILLIEGAYFLMVYVVDKNLRDIDELSRRLREKDAMALQISALNRQMDVILQSRERERILRHDRRHAVRILTHLLQSGQTDEALTFLGRVAAAVPSDARFCRNNVINAIVSYYADCAEKAGVTFEAALDFPQVMGADDQALAVVLSNLLENALHGCLEADGAFGERWIRLKSLCRDQLIIEIANTCAGTVRFDEKGLPIAEGEGHGFGTKSVLAFVGEAGGEAAYSLEENIFRVRLLI